MFGTSQGPLEVISMKGELVKKIDTGWGITAGLTIDTTRSDIYFFSNYGNIYSYNVSWKRPILEWAWEK
jgi:hypothetical protein